MKVEPAGQRLHGAELGRALVVEPKDDCRRALDILHRADWSISDIPFTAREARLSGGAMHVHCGGGQAMIDRDGTGKPSARRCWNGQGTCSNGGIASATVR